MNYKAIALSKGLVYELKRQWNNLPKYQVIDIQTKEVLYYGTNGAKARRIVMEAIR